MALPTRPFQPARHHKFCDASKCRRIARPAPLRDFLELPARFLRDVRRFPPERLDYGGAMALAVNVPHDFLAMQVGQRLIAGAAHDAAMEVIIEVV